MKRITTFSAVASDQHHIDTPPRVVTIPYTACVYARV